MVNRYFDLENFTTSTIWLNWRSTPEMPTKGTNIFFKRNEDNNPYNQERWFPFHDAEVKLFDRSQIATGCFGDGG